MASYPNTPAASLQAPITSGDVQAAIAAGMCIGDTRELGQGLVGLVLPANARLEKVDLEEHQAKHALAPMRKKGERMLATAASFIAYVNAHKIPGTAIYADQDGVSFEAIFNDHEPEPRGEAAKPTPADQEQLQEQLQGLQVEFIEATAAGLPGWGDFKASYGCPLSIEWKRWHGNSQHAASGDSKRGMKHADFIQFLEDNLLDVTAPPSGQLLQMVHSFEAKKDVKFSSASRAQNGSIVFSYSEDVNQVSQPGTLSLPELFTITVPVFHGGARYAIDARLRYRVGQGGLTLWYELVSPHKVLEHAFNTVLDEIRNGTVDVPVYDV